RRPDRDRAHHTSPEHTAPANPACPDGRNLLPEGAATTTPTADPRATTPTTVRDRATDPARAAKAAAGGTARATGMQGAGRAQPTATAAGTGTPPGPRGP